MATMQQPEPDQTNPAIAASPLIDSGEFLMRRVPYQPAYFKKNKLLQGTFLPRKDPDGLSLSRRQTITHPEFLRPDQFKANCSDDKMRRTAGVLLILVDDVWQIVGLLVRPQPVEANTERGLMGDPGHVVIPEINSRQYDDGQESTEETRAKIREMAAALAYRYSDTKHFAILPGEPAKTALN